MGTPIFKKIVYNYEVVLVEGWRCPPPKKKKKEKKWYIGIGRCKKNLYFMEHGTGGGVAPRGAGCW